MSLIAALAVGILWGACNPVGAQSLTSAYISVINDRLASGAVHSWELGTRAEALLEFNAPTYSVLSVNPVPPPQNIASNLSNSLHEVLAIAHSVVANRSISNGNITGPQPLIKDASTGDPASIGVAVLLANWTRLGEVDGLDYAGAARDQLHFLLQNVSRTSDGALSHRLNQLQLWSDFIYMVPPFLAYYGALTQNETILSEAYTQISLYRNYLRDTTANNLWKHIQLGQNTVNDTANDNGHWSTGNAWAAAGMIRVLGTIKHSQYTNLFKSQQNDLTNWIQEIHGGMYPLLNPNGLFYNYADNSSTFYESSSTALLASTVYRLSLLSNVHTYISLAEQSRKALSAPAGITISITTTSTTPTPSTASTAPPAMDTSTPGLLHFTSDGWLTPVVNPNSYTTQGSNSPEGQAFILEMQAAWRDWEAGGAKGANSAREVGPHVFLIGVIVALPWILIVVC